MANKDLLLTRWNNGGVFEEYNLTVQSNSFLFIDACRNLYCVPTASFTASYSITSVTSDYSLDGLYSLSSSFSSKSHTASYFSEASASLITGSLYIKSNSGSLWKVTIYETGASTASIKLEGPF